jgi:hypothetical protein
MSGLLASAHAWEPQLVLLILDSLKNYPNSTLIGKLPNQSLNLRTQVRSMRQSIEYASEAYSGWCMRLCLTYSSMRYK